MMNLQTNWEKVDVILIAIVMAPEDVILVDFVENALI
jgi:hypothetical protein